MPKKQSSQSNQNEEMQKIIIPRGSIDPNEDTVIEIPVALKNQPVVLARPETINQENLPRNNLNKATVKPRKLDDDVEQEVNRERSSRQDRSYTNLRNSKRESSKRHPSEPSLLESTNNSTKFKTALGDEINAELDQTEAKERRLLDKQLREFQNARRQFLLDTADITTKASKKVNTCSTCPSANTERKPDESLKNSNSDILAKPQQWSQESDIKEDKLENKKRSGKKKEKKLKKEEKKYDNDKNIPQDKSNVSRPQLSLQRIASVDSRTQTPTDNIESKIRRSSPLSSSIERRSTSGSDKKSCSANCDQKLSTGSDYDDFTPKASSSLVFNKPTKKDKTPVEEQSRISPTLSPVYYRDSKNLFGCLDELKKPYACCMERDDDIYLDELKKQFEETKRKLDEAVLLATATLKKSKSFLGCKKCSSKSSYEEEEPVKEVKKCCNKPGCSRSFDKKACCRKESIIEEPETEPAEKESCKEDKNCATNLKEKAKELEQLIQQLFVDPCNAPPNVKVTTTEIRKVENGTQTTFLRKKYETKNRLYSAVMADVEQDRTGSIRPVPCSSSCKSINFVKAPSSSDADDISIDEHDEDFHPKKIK